MASSQPILSSEREVDQSRKAAIENRKRLASVLDALAFTVPEVLIQPARDELDHNEIGLALELLVENGNELEVLFPLAQLDELRSLAHAMHLDLDTELDALTHYARRASSGREPSEREVP